MRLNIRGLFAAAALGWAGLAQAEPQPSVAPAPQWITASKVPDARADQSGAPVQMLFSTNQTRFYPDHVETYLEYAVTPQTAAGLQGFGNVVVPWNVDRTELRLHRVEIRRGTQTIDALHKTELMVLRREDNLERAMLDGVRTVVLPVRGLQTGDVLILAASYAGKPGIGTNVPEEFKPWAAPIPVRRMENRFLIPDGLAVRFAHSAIVPKPTVSHGRSGFTEYVFVADDVQLDPVPENAPGRFRMPGIQFTAYRDWLHVADQMRPLYQAARALKPSSALQTEADRIAAASPDPARRMLSALRLAQEQVRYVALALGDGAFVPASADETWERKFGDCKGKTALLLALLDRLGIAADPVLAALSTDDGLNERLPSLLMFDHVFVRARIAGQTYYLDATNYGERSLEELRRSPVKWGLPLIAGASLERLNQPLPTRPPYESELVWDASRGFNDEVPFTARLTLRGSYAAMLRAIIAGATDPKGVDARLKAMMPVIEDKALTIVDRQPEAADGSFVVRFAGKSPMDWSPESGKRGRRYRFDQAVLTWKSEFARDSGMWKDLPAALDSGYWQQATETVILPAGASTFSVEGSDFTKSLAGAEIRRSVIRSADRVTMVSSFRFTKDEITALEARAADRARRSINEDYAWVVAPDGFRMTATERKSILSASADGYDEWMRKGSLELEEGRFRSAIRSFDQAIAENPQAAGAHAAKAIAHAYVHDLAAAKAAIAKASSIDPKVKGLSEARAQVAWLDHDLPAAIRAINEELNNDPDNVRLLLARAELFAGNGQLAEALADARRAHRLSEGMRGADTIARLQAVSGALDAALATLDGAIVDQPDRAAAIHVLRGDLLMSAGRSAEAAQAYAEAAKGTLDAELREQAVAAGADPGAIASSVEEVLLSWTRQFGKLEALVTDQIRTRRYPSAGQYMNRAYYRLRQGKFEGAGADAREALELEPDNSLANMVAGLVAMRKGEFASAERHFTKAIAVRRDMAQLYHARGLARKQLGRTAAADQDLQWARELVFDVAADPIFREMGVSRPR